MSSIWVKGPKQLGHLPLLFHWRGAGSEVEQLGHEPVAIWSAGVTGGPGTGYAEPQPLHLLFSSIWLI